MGDLLDFDRPSEALKESDRNAWNAAMREAIRQKADLLHERLKGGRNQMPLHEVYQMLGLKEEAAELREKEARAAAE